MQAKARSNTRRGAIPRRTGTGVFLLVVLVASTVAPLYGSASGESSAPSGASASVIGAAGEFVAGEVIVRFEPGVPAAERIAARAGIGASIKRALRLPNTQLLTVAPGLTVQEAIRRLEANPNVSFAEPNFIMHLAATTPDDPRFAELWGLHNTGQTVDGVAGTADADIDAPEAWDVTSGNADVLVGIIDTGIAHDHPDLAPNLWLNPGESGDGRETNGVDDDGNGFVDDWRGWDFVNDDNVPRDGDGHGSHVAGTIGARGNNTTGITGVAQQVSMVMAQACNGAGCPSAAVADAMMYVGDLGARIANVSLGGTSFNQVMYDAVAANPGTLYIVAAGNSGADVDVTAHYPCAYDLSNILCVAASDANDAHASFSNFGAAGVDLSAPGVDTLSTFPSLVTPFADDFEGDLTAWSTGGTADFWAIDACDGANCLVDSPDSVYANNTNSWVQTVATFDVSTDVTECSVEYTMSLDVKSGDVFYLEASADGVDWAVLHAWYGFTGGFVPFSAPIDESLGSPIFLRFRLSSDSSVQGDGAAIRSMEVGCVDTTSTTYRFLNGTSMAAPHTAGVAALLQAVDPGITAAQMKTILMDTVDPIDALTGKSVTGGRLNAHLAVLAANAPPVGVDDSYVTDEDVKLVVAAAAGVLVNDSDADGDGLTVSGSATESVEGGVVAVAADGSFTYQPPAHFHGTDSFGYSVSDGASTDTATVTIFAAAVDDAPIGVDDSYGTVEDTQLVVAAAAGVLANDLDADGDSLTVSASAVESVEGGVVAVAADGSFTYTPTIGFLGTDSFGYSVSDGASTDTATVTITVSPPSAPSGGGGGGGGGELLPAPPEACPETLEDPGFVDLDGLSRQAQHAVTCLVAHEIAQGTSATSFSPLLEVTRWQMALFLTRQVPVHGVSLPAPEPHGFTDIVALPGTTQDAINQLATLEITAGTSPTTFDPMSSVSRWQMALFLARLAVLVEIPLDASPPSPFVDTGGLSAEARLAIDRLAEAGIAHGTSPTTFSPAAAVTRWHMALFLTRILTAGGVTFE